MTVTPGPSCHHPSPPPKLSQPLSPSSPKSTPVLPLKAACRAPIGCVCRLRKKQCPQLRVSSPDPPTATLRSAPLPPLLRSSPSSSFSHLTRPFGPPPPASSLLRLSLSSSSSLSFDVDTSIRLAHPSVTRYHPAGFPPNKPPSPNYHPPSSTFTTTSCYEHHTIDAYRF